MDQSRPIKQPGPDHPITIEPNPARVLVTVAGEPVADTERALTLREAGYGPVLYIPPEDVDESRLVATEHTSYCPYKGQATYFSVPAGGERSANAAWMYASAYPAVAAIAGHLAFYPGRVESIRELPAREHAA